MKFNLKKLLKNDFISNALTLVSGTAVAQIVALLSSFFVFGILYTPAQLGFSANFMLWVEVIAIVASGRYEYSIVLPEDDNDGFNITILTLILSYAFCALLFVILLAVKFALGAIITFPQWFLLLPLGIVLVSNYQALTYWYIRRKQFKRISLNRILQTTFYSVTAIIYALVARKNGNITFNGLVFSQLVSQSLVLLLFFIDYLTDYKKTGYKVQLKSIRAVAKRYIHFPKVTIFSGLINGISTRIPQILLQFFFGDVVVGYYSFTNRLLATPVSLVSSAIGDVFRQRASEEYASHGQCRDTYKKTFKGLAVFSIVAFVAIGILAPWVFRVLFDGKWAIAGIYISIMAVLYMVRFVASPLSFMLIITEKLKQDLIWQACLLVSTVAVSAVGFYMTNNHYVVISLFTVVSTLAYIVNLYMTRKLSLGEGK